MPSLSMCAAKAALGAKLKLPESLKFLKYEVCRERKGKKGQLMLGDLTRKKHSPT